MAPRFAVLLVWLLVLPAAAQVTADDLIWNFECGSLGSAATLAGNDISLTLRQDAGPLDLYGWYDFRITQHALNQSVHFRFANGDGWQNENHRPIYSYDGRHWMRVAVSWMENGQLHFQQTFTADSAEIALVFPYRYSDLLADFDTLAASPFVTVEEIGRSVHDRAIPLVTITDPAVPIEQKRCVWITSRHHPMETPPGYAIRSLMNWLAAANDTSAAYLGRTVYKIVPCVNVDGAAEGFSRQNASGINLNRNWNTSPSGYSGEEPEVEAVHRAIDEWFAAGHSLGLFVDMHAAPDQEDFGYRFSEAYSSPAYYAESGRAIQCIADRLSFQASANWRDLDQNYGSGLSIMAVYARHETVCLSSEYPWSRHENGSYVTLDALRREGPLWAMALDDYLYPESAEPRQSIPSELSFSVQPNPFNAQTALSFVLPHDGFAEIQIFDNLGRRAETPLRGQLAAGEHRVSWNAQALPTGIYYARMDADGRQAVRKLILIR